MKPFQMSAWIGDRPIASLSSCGKNSAPGIVLPFAVCAIGPGVVGTHEQVCPAFAGVDQRRATMRADVVEGADNTVPAPYDQRISVESMDRALDENRRGFELRCHAPPSAMFAGYLLASAFEHFR